MTIISVDDVQRKIGLDDTALTDLGITDAQITEHIYDAEAEMERICKTIFLVPESATNTKLTATSGGATTIVDTDSAWTVSAFIDYFVYINSGTGSGQWRKITSNDTTTLTVATWETNPDNTSVFTIVYAPYSIQLNEKFNPYQSITVDGDGTKTFFTPKSPLLRLDSLTINSTSVTTSNVYKYLDTGKLQLSTDAEYTYFDATKPQLVSLSYWTGIYPAPRIVKKGLGIIAGISTLIQQVGGTYDDVATFSMPHITGSLGQPYINIAQVIEQLRKDWITVEKLLPKYYYSV